MRSVSACAIDCQVQGEVPASPAQLLRSISRGAYTALQAEGPAFKVVGLQEHLLRLRDSLSWLHQLNSNPRGQDARCELLEDSARCEGRLWKVLSPTMRVAADTAKQHNPQCLHWMIVLHLSLEDAHTDLLKATVFIKPLASSTGEPVDVAVLGPPRAGLPARSLPAAKDSQWATDRMVHENHLPEGITEGILCSHDNALLEGLITNIFVVTEAEGQAVLQTAHPSQEILDGVMRRLVIQACRKVGVKCLEDAPKWDQRHSWVQAFTCNSVAGVRMISSMVPVWDTAVETLRFPSSPCQVMQKVSTTLAEMCEMRAESLLSDTL